MGTFLGKDEYGSGDSWTQGNEHGSRGKTVNTSQTFLNADKIYAELIAAGNDWADKKAAAKLLEESKNSLIAKLTAECRFIEGDSKPIMSRVEAEQAALASHQYQDWLAGMVEARRIADRAEVRYSAIQTLAELRRSQESTRRAELQHL